MQAAQVKEFEMWAKEGNWSQFHSNHYDWWTFPIDLPSSFGHKYTLDEEALSALYQDSEFLETLSKAASLLLLSWGWDIEKQELISQPDPDQHWASWPIRLAKCNRSLKLFQLNEFAESTATYARWLRDKGETFSYMGRDLYPEILDPLP